MQDRKNIVLWRGQPTKIVRLALPVGEKAPFALAKANIPEVPGSDPTKKPCIFSTIPSINTPTYKRKIGSTFIYKKLFQSILIDERKNFPWDKKIH